MTTLCLDDLEMPKEELIKEDSDTLILEPYSNKEDSNLDEG